MVDTVLAFQPQRVLDLGCGEDWLVLALMAHGIDRYEVDSSPALIDLREPRHPHTQIPLPLLLISEPRSGASGMQHPQP